MLMSYLSTIFARDLRALSREIRTYPDDDSLWNTPTGVTNSGGNLVLHLTGNLRHFVGTTLGGDTYHRDREAEFSQRGLPERNWRIRSRRLKRPSPRHCPD